ncbi:MAG: heavy-metal-associated domain-containing protein [Oscillospiraceae bacterium]
MKKTYKLENLCCANCAAAMENAVARLPGVHKVSVAFMLQRMTVEADESLLPGLYRQIRDICRKIEPRCEVR